MRVRFRSEKPYRDLVDGEMYGCGLSIETNGWKISAQAGWGNYHTLRPAPLGDGPPDGLPPGENPAVYPAKDCEPLWDCEIALWRTSGENPGKMIQLGNDTVEGWVPWRAVFDLTAWIDDQAETPSEEDVAVQVERLVTARRRPAMSESSLHLVEDGDSWLLVRIEQGPKPRPFSEVLARSPYRQVLEAARETIEGGPA